MGSLIDSSFSPSCCCTATKKSGAPESDAWAETGVKIKMKA